MTSDFNHWHKRWADNRIGFHESKVNRYLQKYLSRFALPSDASLFLPLCGKSIDIAWLAEQDFNVVGIELSSIAIEAFFSEQALAYQSFQSDRFTLRKSGKISLLEGNFFDLQKEDLEHCQLVYDRASLIALSQQQRVDYYRHLAEILPAQSKMLLITLNYQQSNMSGPPYAVSDEEVIKNFAGRFSITELEKNDIVDEIPRWREQGLTELIETVFQMEPRE